MIKIEMTAHNFDEVQKALSNLGDRIKNPDLKLMGRIGDTIIDDIDKRFMTRGYGTWPPLKPSTIAKKGFDFVLIETGVMMASVNYKVTGPGQVEVDVPVSGKNHDPSVPRKHQEGEGRIPQRKIVDVTPKLVQAITATVTQWVQDMIKAFGRTV